MPPPQIDDVVYVIDSARQKEKGYEAGTRMSSLLPGFVSRDSLLQRRGRAGRVQPGVCFHLLTRAQERSLAQHQVPEILRTALEELCLAAVQLNLGGRVKRLLARTPEPPSRHSVALAMQQLMHLGAVTTTRRRRSVGGGGREGEGGREREQLTAVGRHLARLSVEPRLGMLLLMGCVMGADVAELLLTLVAMLSHRDPFVAVAQERKGEAEAAKRTIAGEGYRRSDHLLLLAVYQRYEQLQCTRGDRAASAWCRDHFLSPSALQMAGRLRRQFSQQLAKCGFVVGAGQPHRSPGTDATHHSGTAKDQTSLVVIRALLGSAFSPDMAWAVHDGTGKAPAVCDRHNSAIAVAGSSVAVEAGGGGISGTQWLIFGEQIKTAGWDGDRIRRSGLTMVPPLAFILLCRETPLLQKDPVHTAGGGSTGGGLMVVSAVCPALRFRVAKAALDSIVLLEQLHSALRCLMDAAMTQPRLSADPSNRAIVAVTGELLRWSESHASGMGCGADYS
eukprot:COSAG01_NODE_3347_length_6227_cov_155.357878_2_plen_505_part_00